MGDLTANFDLEEYACKCGCGRADIKSELVNKIQKILGNKTINYNVIAHPDTYPADEPLRRCPNIDKARTTKKIAGN